MADKEKDWNEVLEDIIFKCAQELYQSHPFTKVDIRVVGEDGFTYRAIIQTA